MIEEKDEKSTIIEVNQNLKDAQASRIFLGTRQSHVEAQSPITPSSTFPRGIVRQAKANSEDYQKEDNECEHQLDDLNI